jgi:Zn-finger protein
MKALKVCLIVAIVALAPALAWAFTPGAGIAGTPHDFSSKGGGVGACTFCHTPHKALATQLLWNHTLSTNSFKWDVPSTTAGTPYATFKGDTYKGPTAKCLSCHDGSVAVGDIAWWNEGPPGVLDNTKHGAGDAANIGLGGDMAGNHPVAMPYPMSNARNTYNGVKTGAGFVSGEWASPPLGNIRIFQDDGSGNIAAADLTTIAGTSYGIECSSCHDPHNKAAVDDIFLRGTLKGATTAYICLKCHIK